MEFVNLSALLAKLMTRQLDNVQAAMKDSYCFRSFASKTLNQKIPIALISIMECAKNARKDSIFSTENVN